METLLISSEKLKIILNERDIAKYSLDCEHLDYGNTETRRAFWTILDDAKHRTGFDAADRRVLIQAYVSKSGICELYVTKIGERESAQRDGDAVSFEIAESTCASERIFEFASIHELLSAAGAAMPLIHRDVGSVYAEESASRTRYFLLLPPEEARLLEHLLLDFSHERTGKASEGYLREHCRCICASRAIGIMASLA